ncbi:phage tail tape measure protein [Comamonas testosteroni]|uniref:phage tail tape measure protein n=1 Tax=Comamonas testosteroni TaxID=285 RepID=UPI00187BF157|nr:phage tail tape measure protein [Comamonas testosteroni]
MGSVAPKALAAMQHQYQSIGRTIDQLIQKQTRLASLQAQGTALRDARGELRGQAMGAIGTAMSVALPLGKAVHMATGFQDQMRDTAITGDFSKAEEAQISKSVRESALKWNQTQAEVAKGTAVLVAAGIQDAKELERFTPLMAKSATATRASMEDLGSVAAALRDNLGITATGFESSLNMLAYAGKRGQFEIRDMAKWLPNLTPVFGDMGVMGKEAVAEIGAALQIARKGAGSNDEAANNFRNFLQKLFSQDTKKDFEKAGIDIESSLKSLRAKGLTPVQGMLEIVTDYMKSKGPGAANAFTKAMETKDDKERQMAVQRVAEAYKLGELFQDMQAMAFIRPAIANMAEMKDIKRGSMEAADKGLLDNDFKRRTETAAEQFKSLKIGLSELGISVGTILLPPLVSAVNTITPMVRSFSEWAQKHPSMVKGILGLSVGLVAANLAFIGIKFAALTAAIQVNTFSKGIALASMGWTRLQAMQQTGTFTAMASRLSSIGGGLATGFKAALPWLGRIGATLLRLTPMGLALSAVGLVVYKYWQPIKGFFVGLWQGFSSVAGPAIRGLMRSVLSLGTSFGRVISSIPGIGFALQLVRSIAGPALNAIIDGARSAWSWFKNLLKPVEDVGGKAQNMGLRVGQALGGIVKEVASLPGQFIKLGTNIVEGLVTGIKERIGDAINMVGQLGEAVASKFKSALGIHSPSRVFMGFGDNISQGAAIGIARSAPYAGQAAGDMAQSAASAASASLGKVRIGGRPEIAGMNGTSRESALVNAAEAMPSAQAALAAANKAGIQAGAGLLTPSSGGQAGAASGVVIHLTQTFNLEGAAQGVKTQIQEATQLTVREFERLMERYTREKRRTGYA